MPPVRWKDYIKHLINGFCILIGIIYPRYYRSENADTNLHYKLRLRHTAFIHMIRSTSRCKLFIRNNNKILVTFMTDSRPHGLATHMSSHTLSCEFNGLFGFFDFNVKFLAGGHGVEWARKHVDFRAKCILLVLRFILKLILFEKQQFVIFICLLFHSRFCLVHKG